MSYATLTSTGTFAVHDGIPDYDALRTGVGGYIEAVRFDVPDGGTCVMWLNEEGKLNGLPLNERATRLAHIFRAIFPDDYIAGNVVFTGGPDDEGETLPLPEPWLNKLKELFG